MSEFFTFAGNNPWLTFFLSVIVSITVVAPFKYTFLIFNRYMRSRNIAARGWPTHPRMDADGDIVPTGKDS